MTQFDANLPTGILPDGGPFTEAGAKTWHVVPGTSPRRSARARTKSFTYTVEVEDGVDTTAFGGDEAFARMVSETLANPKSWTHNPQFAFTRIDDARGQPDFRVSLTSPMTVREGCGYDIPLEASCYNPAYLRRTSPASSSTRPAGCAAPCRSRATSAPTGSTWSTTRSATPSAISITSRAARTARWRR